MCVFPDNNLKCYAAVSKNKLQNGNWSINRGNMIYYAISCTENINFLDKEPNPAVILSQVFE